MTMRWYGKGHDTVTLQQIRQSCYVKGIITTLYDKLPGEVWTLDEILAMKKEVEDASCRYRKCQCKRRHQNRCS